MHQSNLIYCERITKLNQESQNQRLRLFAKVDISTKLKILQLQKQIFHKLKNSYCDVDNVVLTLSSIILAVDGIAKELNIVHLNAIKLRGKNNTSKIKRQKLLRYWAIVKTLKLEQKMSFRQISEYFLKYHKLKISYSTIYELWKELEENTNKKEN